MAPPEYQFNWHHGLLYDALDEFARGECKRLIIEMPPGHGKSEGTSRILPAYLLGKNPDERIIACSHTDNLSSDMNRDVQKIMDNPNYRTVFPATRLNDRNVRDLSGSARRNSDVFDVVGHNGFYRSAGVGTGITGKRFSKGLIDDPIKDRETANSVTQRESIWRWYTGSFFTRQTRDAAICITSTRWHEDDLVGRIRKKEPNDWKVITLPAIATGVNPHPLDRRQPGEALWPWFNDLPFLHKYRDTEPRDFYALYQQDPKKEGDVEFPPEWFGPSIWFDDWPSEILYKVMSLDPSKGKNAKHGDYSAFIKLGMTIDKTLWVEADLARRPTTRIIEDGLRLFTEWGPQAFAIEINQFQELLGGEFMRVARDMGLLSLPIYGINNTINKEVRIRQVGPLLGQARIRFRKTPGTQLLVQQLGDFPTAQFDDGPDALQMAVVMLTWLLGGRKGGKGQPVVMTV